MNRLLKYCLLFFMLLPAVNYAQLRVDGDFVYDDLEMFFLNDLDLTNPGSSPVIFYVTMENQFPENRYVIFSLRIESERYGLLAQGSTKPFLLGHGETRTITNRDLGTAGSDFELGDYSIETSVQDLVNAILSTGTLPSDHYTFHLKLQDKDDPNIVAVKPIELEITNPTSIELVSPGRPADEEDLPVLFTTLPQFVWESDARQFEITVVEALPDQPPDEAMVSNEPRLRQTISDATTLLYPSSGPGVLALEEGKTYFWQVVARVTTSSGEVKLPSEIYGFRIGRMTPGETSRSDVTMLLALLQQILGDDSVLNTLSEQGFAPTGVILYRGTPISIAELQSILQEIRSGQREVVNYVIEE